MTEEVSVRRFRRVRRRRRRRPITKADVRIVVSPSAERINANDRQRLAKGRGSLQFILGSDREKRSRLLEPGLQWSQVVLAKYGRHTLGYAAFTHYGRGSPYQPSLKDFLRVYGLSGLWRYAGFWAIESRNRHAACYLYSLWVHKRFRGRGIAQALLDAVRKEGLRLGAEYIELEVISRHQDAQKLYERYGFKEHKTHHFGWAERFFHFSRVTRMRLPLR